MTIRRILIIAPLALVALLLQSYFWVPTYEEQTKGNPERLQNYIEASIGDASILNPTLSADSASSEIEGKVFEGLIDRDENLRYRGRVARSWEILEEAYFNINERAEVPGHGKAPLRELLSLLQKARQGLVPVDSRARPSLDRITDISIDLPRTFLATKREQFGKDGTREIRFAVRAPARIKITLSVVDQDLFEALSYVLGPDYFSSFPAEAYVQVEEVKGPKPSWPESSLDPQTLVRKYAQEILPATEHNPVIVFHLRPGVRFHDGHVLEAHDVKFTYDAIMDPANLSPRTPDYEPVKVVEVVDPMTVRITYKRLHSPAFGTWGMGILPEHLLNKEALRQEAVRKGKAPNKFTLRESGFGRNPVGCGPFRFKEWKSDQYILLERFDQYWEGPANYRRFAYRIIPDLLTQEMEFYAGTVDTYAVQPHQVERLKRDPAYQSFSGLSFGYTYIGYNMRREPFSDPLVRRALGMAIDVGKIIRYVLRGQGEPITGPFAKQTDYYNHAVPPLPHDSHGALRLLEEAGWKKNREGWLEKNGKRLGFTLITNSGNDTRKAIATIAQDAWRRIGIDVRTDLLEWSVFIQERVDKADFDALILGWQMGIDPDLFQIWHSSQTNPKQLNFVGFRNQEADELILRIRQEYNHERQVNDCHRLHEIIVREQPYTFLYVGKWTAVMDRRIVIKEVDAAGRESYKKIQPTKTGSFSFYFNKWIKLPHAPNFALEG